MAFGVVSGFKPTLVTTTAASLIATGPNYFCGRLIAGGAAVKARVYNHNAATPSASALVAVLSCPAANGTDELSVPIRCDVGVVVKMSANTGTLLVFTR